MITRLTDYSIAMATMQECWNEMCEDDSGVQAPDLINEYWLSVEHKGEYAGFFRIAQNTSVLFECHACILEKYRIHVVNFATQSYQWILDSLPTQKLVCNIPDFNKKAIVFAKRMGFKQHGFIADSYMRKGNLCGMVQMGISREEMRGFICHQQQSQ